MNVDTQTPVKENEVQEQQLPKWKKPVIMRIEFKRTMEDAGSGEDSIGKTNTDPTGS